jgi:hypothetical protein
VRLPGWFLSLSMFLCAIGTCLLCSLGERIPPLDQHNLVAPDQGHQWAGDIKPLTRRWKHYPPTPRQTPKNVAERLRQKLRGHQSFQEASVLSKLAVTQWTQVQSLSTKSKGGCPFIPLREGYRNGGGIKLIKFVPYIITCYFIGYFNLWGLVTLLWSPGNIPQLQFSFVLL